jgi:ribonuclease VapC
MVIDTSAVVAILRLENEADAFLRAIASTDACTMSAVSALEAAMVLAGVNGGPAVWQPLDDLLAKAAVDIAPFDSLQASIARSAFMRFGKGKHPAALNFGDCASYALAMTRKAPLLFKGNDFSKTDVVAALPQPYS